MRTVAVLAPITLLFACAAPVDAPAPSAQAIAPNSVALGSEVLLDGDRSRGVDLSFEWRFIATPPSSALNERTLEGGSSSLAWFTPDVPGAYTMALQACDVWLRCAVSKVAIEVTPLLTDAGTPSSSNLNENRPPQASAQATLGRSGDAPWVFLNGQESTDPDGDSLLFGWSFVSRPADSAIVPEDIEGQGEERAAFQPDVAGTWVLRLTVTDLSASSTMVLEDILINENSWDIDLPE